VDPRHNCPCQGKVWGVRSLRFSPSSTLGRLNSYSDNRELLVFSEHQSTIHIVDARTFDTSPESRQSLFLPSILQRYPRALHSEQLTKPVEEVIAKRGKKRKRNGDTDGDEAERKRREPADGATDLMRPVSRQFGQPLLYIHGRILGPGAPSYCPSSTHGGGTAAHFYGRW
jgi:hypothetical protein